MLPEVQEYFDEVERAAKKRDQLINEARAKYDQWSDNYYFATNAANDDFAVAKNMALRNLRATTKHPVVRYMATHPDIAGNAYHWRHAEQILRILPATIPEIEKLAEKGSWCIVWNQFRNEALKRGALDDYVVLQYKQNDQPWRRLKRKIRMENGNYLEHDQVIAWFTMGVKEFEFQIRHSTYRFRLHYTGPIK